MCVEVVNAEATQRPLWRLLAIAAVIALSLALYWFFTVDIPELRCHNSNPPPLECPRHHEIVG